jgi:hypothetical protein
MMASMSGKILEPKRPLSETVKEHWSDKLELGGSTSSYVACYAANQVLGTIWRGNTKDADAKEIRERTTLRRLADIGARDVIEVMLAAQRWRPTRPPWKLSQALPWPSRALPAASWG